MKIKVLVRILVILLLAVSVFQGVQMLRGEGFLFEITPVISGIVVEGEPQKPIEKAAVLIRWFRYQPMSMGPSGVEVYPPSLAFTDSTGAYSIRRRFIWGLMGVKKADLTVHHWLYQSTGVSAFNDDHSWWLDDAQAPPKLIRMQALTEVAEERGKKSVSLDTSYFLLARMGDVSVSKNQILEDWRGLLLKKKVDSLHFQEAINRLDAFEKSNAGVDWP